MFQFLMLKTNIERLTSKIEFGPAASCRFITDVCIGVQDNLLGQLFEHMLINVFVGVAVRSYNFD